jgi:tetratricopeptide (TPR) repeat protein
MMDPKRIAGIREAFTLFSSAEDAQKTADRLWAAWIDLWGVLTEEGIRSEKVAKKQIDWQFGNWANDVDDALNRAKRYQDQIELSRNILEIEWDSKLFHENARRTMADCHAQLGDAARARELYEGYLKDDPRWGWGWIGYLRLLEDNGDARLPAETDAMRVRLEGDPEIRDAEDVYEELGRLYADCGETGMSVRCFAAGKAIADAKPGFLSGGLNKAPLTSAIRQAGTAAAPKAAKVGRNDPCPCGSGKKYKKCCGGNHSWAKCGRASTAISRGTCTGCSAWRSTRRRRRKWSSTRTP